MKFNTQFIPSEEDSNTRKIATLISIVLYLFTLLLGYSPINYFLISGLVIIQLYFLITRSQESYEFRNNQLIYTFLFYKKTIDFTSFSLKNGEYKDSYKRKSNGQLIELYNQDKIVCSIKDVHNKYVFDEILSYLETNYPEIKKNEDFKISYLEKSVNVIMLLISFFLLVFTISLYIENYHSNKIQNYDTIKGHLAYQPKKDFSGKKKNRKEYLIFKLKEYPQIKFNLQYEKFIKINGYEFVKTNHQNNVIEFEIFKEDNDYSIKKLAQPYFSSHFNNKKIISIRGLKYDNQNLININPQENNNESYLNLSYFFIIATAIIIIHSLYYLSKILK